MKIFQFFLIFTFSLEFQDFFSNSVFLLDSLNEKTFSIDLGDSLVYFKIGGVLKRKCGKDSGSVIRFQKDSGKCEVLGKDESRYYSSIISLGNPGIEIQYLDGNSCFETWEGKIEKVRYSSVFLIWCSQEEHDFQPVRTSEKCKVVFKKFSKAGCPSQMVQSLLGKVFIYLCGIGSVFLLAFGFFLWIFIDLVCCWSGSGKDVAGSVKGVVRYYKNLNLS